MARVTQSPYTIHLPKTRTKMRRALPHSEGSRTCHLSIETSETMEDPQCVSRMPLSKLH